MSASSHAWDTAVASLRTVTSRPEVILEEVPAPSRLAPHSVALAVDVVSGSDDDLASGRFVVLHDPDGQPTWEGTFRIVTFIKAAQETEMVTDELFDEVAWSYHVECLQDVPHHALSGTVTRTVSRSFAGLQGRGIEAEVEIRASWTPDTQALDEHLSSWLSVAEKAAGLVPLPAGIAHLRTRI